MRGIDFEAGGATHRLRFSFNELSALEQATGLPMDQLGGLLQPGEGKAPKATDLILLFWGGLGAKGTKEAAGELMSELGYMASAKLIMQAFVEAFPQLSQALGENDAAAQTDAVGNESGAAA